MSSFDFVINDVTSSYCFSGRRFTIEITDFTASELYSLVGEGCSKTISKVFNYFFVEIIL